MERWPAHASKITARTVAPYIDAVSECSLEAIERACRAFGTGAVPDWNPDYGPPVPVRLAMLARLLEPTKSVPLYGGLLEVDFGHGRIDLRGLKIEEQDAIMRQHGKTPDGRNYALLSLDEKRAAISGIEGPRTVTARLQRMGG